MDSDLLAVIVSFTVLWKRVGPCGVPGHKILSVSPVSGLQEIDFVQAPWLSPSFKGQVQTVANHGREGMQRYGRNSQEIVQPWGRVLILPQGRHTTMSLSCFADTEPPTKWKIITIWWSILCSIEMVTQFKNLENHRSPSRNHLMPNDFWIEGMQSLHAPWPLSAIPLLDSKTPHKPPGLGQFWEYHPAVAPLA